VLATLWADESRRVCAAFMPDREMDEMEAMVCACGVAGCGTIGTQ
jgi:hypothetical protein